MEKIPLGIKLNNPCNICKGSQWKGLRQYQFPSRFCDFENHIYGIRAFLIVLRTYVVKHAIRSVRGFVNRYAPAGDGNNNPGKYAAYILNRWRTLGFDVSQDSLVFDKSWFSLNVYEWSDKQLLLYCFVNSVCKVETGFNLTADDFCKAYEMI